MIGPLDQSDFEIWMIDRWGLRLWATDQSDFEIDRWGLKPRPFGPVGPAPLSIWAASAFLPTYIKCLFYSQVYDC